MSLWKWLRLIASLPSDPSAAFYKSPPTSTSAQQAQATRKGQSWWRRKSGMAVAAAPA
jgi:hypothetical protein